ncbi:MAG: tetratricopeptide repeat protein [Planctomycetota bacterium]
MTEATRHGIPVQQGSARPGARTFLASLLALLVAACSAPTDPWSATWTDPYAGFDEAGRARLVEARALLDGGQRVEALDALRVLAADDPENLEVACSLQDVEIDLLRDGVRVFGPSESAQPFEPDEVLRREYARRNEESQTVFTLVLAARAETDVLAAEALLEKARELDPVCAWVHYGLAHVLLEKRTQKDRWGLARESLDRAIELEPGHLRARRLEAWMLAEQGSRDAAERSLRRWIDEVSDDPRVARSWLVEAKLDLALLMLLRGEDERAQRVLEDLEGEAIGRARRWMLLTVARQESGDVLGALDATLRAQGASAGTVLPIVQEALLLELFLDRPSLAQARWDEVARLVEDTTSIGELVQGLRARVRVERDAAQRAAATEATSK